MAAKQGFTAHISQASEDAKRAVLSRAPSAIKSHSWLSNLNTTCTIKSAPPRTPEVMTMLSVKSGWLVKRNEQHVWQRRWCCVVPHMMLYYFEAEPEMNSNDDCDENSCHVTASGGGVYRSDALIVENQDVLNAAVRDGYNSKTRHSTPLRGRDGVEGANSPRPVTEKKMLAAPVRGPRSSSTNLSPAGIIDLECYTCVNRSSVHDCVFELTGDSVLNPDLRSFYFQAADVEDCEKWTNALLSDRHSALRDEREAYRQVCDSFQLQLQNMSDMIDTAEGKTADVERQLYNVRSKAQKFRSDVVAIVKDALEQSSWGSATEMDKILELARMNYIDQLDEIIVAQESLRSSSKTSTSPVQVLADYLATVVGSHTELTTQMVNVEQKLNQSANVDNATVSDLKLKIKKLEQEREEQKTHYESKISRMEQQMLESQKAYEELENQLQSQRLEFTMFQNQAKAKLQELSSHKKILKKEVIELRKKKEQIESERDAALHITESHKMQAETVKEKNDVLERYIENMENQVRVQQNMMEMISLSGMSQSGMSHEGESYINGGSVVGRIIGAPDDNSYSSIGNMISNRIRDASPYRLPPSRRPRLPPGPPPTTISKKEVEEPTSPLSPASPQKQGKKFFQYSSDAERDTYDSYPGVQKSRGVLDQEFSNGNTNFPRTPDLTMGTKDEDEGRNGAGAHEERMARNQTAKVSNEKKREKEHTPKISNQFDSTLEDSDSDSADGHDDKTNVSELTEDRTQRHMDASFDQTPIHYTVSDTTGENVIPQMRQPELNKAADIKSTKIKYEKLPPSMREDFPPRYIIGAPEEAGSNTDIRSSTKPDDSLSTEKTVFTDSVYGKKGN
jgi:PH domain.